MRLAFADLLFSWPPHGGADVDLFHTAAGLQSAGHDVHVFAAARDDSWERGAFDPAALPFPTTRLVFTKRTLKPNLVARRFKDAVDAWKPDLVFVTDGFFLKPALSLALAAYPTIGRYYAYEVGCMRDSLLFKDGAPCPYDYLATPEICRPCALKGMKPGIVRSRLLAWAEEYVAARAYMPGYHAHLQESLRSYNAIVVSNPIMRRHVESCNANIHILPGGVDVGEYACGPPVPKDRTVILMAGRVEDPMKGLATLLEAGRILAKKRNDFTILATHTDHTLNNDWFQAVGWHDRESIKELYGRADICVTPSIWDEPFGLVAVEAMASARPVVATRVGGLQGIVVDGKTGLLCDRNDAAGLAKALEFLLNNSELRLQMGLSGRQRAESEYDWRGIIERYYPPLFASVRP